MSGRAVTIRNLVLVCSVWFLLGSANAIGQDQSQAETAPVVVTPDETSPVEIDEPEVVNDLVVEEEAIDSNSAETPEGEITESTGRFVPTEEISQDLGVSFPANI